MIIPSLLTRTPFPLFGSVASLLDLTAERNPALREPELVTAHLPSPRLCCLSSVCFRSLDFYVFHFLSRLRSLGLIYKGPSGYLQKRMKTRQNTRGQENNEGQTQFPVPSDSLSQKLWDGAPPRDFYAH